MDALNNGLVIGISGASGVIYGLELLRVLQNLSIDRHLIITAAGKLNFQLETDYTASEAEKLATVVYDDANLTAPVASGSFLAGGMVVIPCSIKTLSAIANSYSAGLLGTGRGCHPERTAPAGSGGAGNAFTSGPSGTYAAGRRHGRHYPAADAGLLSSASDDSRSYQSDPGEGPRLFPYTSPVIPSLGRTLKGEGQEERKYYFPATITRSLMIANHNSSCQEVPF